MEDKGRTILILGNGFDLAHGLPTKYSHFLEFCQRVEKIWSFGVGQGKRGVASFEERWIDNWRTNESIRTDILAAFEKRNITINSEGSYDVTHDSLELSEIHNLLENNVWYKYFTKLYKENCMKGENWIDFESEICFIIREVDQNSSSLTMLWDEVISKDPKFKIFRDILKFDKYIQDKGGPTDNRITVKNFREKVFEDLEHLTRALELYLTTFVEKIPIINKIPEIINLDPDYVINFNYTDTYQRVYTKGQVYHIHGKADGERPAKENNMVLGIDEYWLGNERDERINFTIFKKFSQRIQKHTGNEHYKYLKEMQEVFSKKSEIWSGSVDTSKVHADGVSYVYVFGHSLDITDKDILSSFIGNDSTSVTIYCMDKGTEGELIANTIKLIGEERLIEKSNAIPVKLNYVLQE